MSAATGMPNPRDGQGGGGRKEGGSGGRLSPRHPMVWRLVAFAAVGLAVWWFSARGREVPLPLVQDDAGEVASTWADADWDIFSAKVRWGLERGLDTLAAGPAMARLGETFVGTPYVPRTLDPQGPERLVVDFRGLDCVTFVETVFATVRFLRQDGAGELLDDRGAAEERYEQLLAEIRYRRGIVDGYASRLHYFSEWISVNADKGLVHPVTLDLGGARIRDTLDFMSTHPDAYHQLADSATRAAIREMEDRLSAEHRWYIPQSEIADVAQGIRDGDIIAATSTVEGLDVAHTGLALWRDGTLRLMHAPLVGDSVQISDRSLAERIQAIQGQDGIMVARPLPDEGG